ncbi:ribonuclease H-like domain-containing protein [Tanacetum coccineum]
MNSALQNDQLVFKDSFDKNIHTLNFFDEKLSVTQSSISPNDDGRGSATPNDDGNDHPCTRSSNTSDDSEDDFTTSMGDNSNSEGNVHTSSSINTRKNLLENSSQGEIERYKARLVAKGFSQREGFDYLETFSPLVKMSTVRCMLNVTMCNNWDLFQLDINNDFLYGDLSKDVYMTFPLSFNNDKSKVSLVDNGFVQSKFDFSLFTKKYDDVFIAMLVYVNDIVITGSNLSEIEKFKLFLKSKFQIKDLVKLKYFLGIEVLDNKDGICLSQRKYCLELLHEYGMLAAKHVDTSLPENTTLNHVESDDDHLLSDVGKYQRLVGKLKYLTNTRPDISYVVHCLSQFMHTPLESHLDDALRVSRYLKGSPGRGFQISKHGNLKSSGEAKYRSMASATCDIIWLSNLLGDMGVKGLLPVVM